MAYQKESNNLAYLGTLNTFSNCHHLAFFPLESGISLRAYFCPPSYGFIPTEMKSILEFEVPWTYSFWHELRHAEDFTVCSIGVYQELLSSLSEELSIYGLSLIIKGKTNLGLEYIQQAIKLLPKITLLGKICKVSMEVNPTYFQLSEETSKRFVDLAYPLLKRYHPESNVTADRFETFTNDCRQMFEKRKLEVRPEHRKGLAIGKRIVEEYGNPDYVLKIPLISMQVDLLKVDLVGMQCGELQALLESQPDRYIPDSRCFSLAKNRGNFDKLRHKSKEISMDPVEESRRIFSHPSLPRKMIDFFDSVIKERAEKTDRRLSELGFNSEKPLKLSEVDVVLKAQGIYSFEGGKGAIFLLVPPFVQPDDEIVQDFAQILFSKTYAHELIVRAFAGKQRYSNEFLVSLRTSLEDMSKSVSRPQNYHVVAEALIEKLFDQRDVQRMIPKLN